MYGETVSCAAETWFRCYFLFFIIQFSARNASLLQSVAKYPADDAGIALISAVPGKRLLVPELVRRRPVRQLEQQRGADVVGAVGRADRPAENEAVAVRRAVCFVRMEVRAEELRRAGLGYRAQELLQALAAIVGLALLEAVRPAVNLDALKEAGLAHGLARDECIHRRALVELHEERRAQRVVPVVGDEMAVADDALAEIFDVALLALQQGAPRGLRPRLVPAVDRPLGRLRAVVVPQRLPAQSISRIARQISGHGSLDRPTPSFSPDVRRFDDRPPLLNLGRVVRGERLRRLLLAWKYLLAEICEPRTHVRIGECLP